MQTEGVMSGIIDAKPFNNVFKATKNNSTMQGTVTALYEIGKCSNSAESGTVHCVAES